MLDNIIAKIVAETGQPEEVVERAVRSQFDFIAQTMREAENSVHLHYLGKFCIKPGTPERLRILNEKRERYRRRTV